MKNLYYKSSAWISASLLALIPAAAFAQLSKAQTDLTAVSGELGDSPKELPVLIGKLINVFLSVLGIIFVVLVVYAGYLWMTDAGEGKKVEKAKALLGTAIIGLVIIVAAYAISAFVINRITEGVK